MNMLINDAGGKCSAKIQTGIGQRESSNQRGFSIIEFMIAVLLGIVLTSGVISVYIESKRNYSYDDEVARLQENGRYAINLVRNELTQAGYWGGRLDTIPSAAVTTDCVSAGNWALQIGDPVDLIDTFASSLSTVKGEDISNCLDSTEIQLGTDIISVKRTAGQATLKDGVFPAGVAAADTSQWYLRVEDYGKTVSWVYLNGSGTIPTAEIGASTGFDYWEYYAKVFYIRDFAETTGDGIPTLAVESLRGDDMGTDAMVRGVEDMQIEFGIDAGEDDTPDQYKDAPTADDLKSVVSARIYLLLRSEIELPGYTNTKIYTLGGKILPAKNDGFMRKVYSTTVQMRNAIPPGA
ncbi:MAG: PilW family protein [Porticoccaceae bacterium]